MKRLIVIPAYNEEENILRVCSTIENFNKKNTNKLDYIVINDASKDKTLEKLKKNKINHINLLHNLGIGGAVQTGYKYAYENNYDIAVQFDGDGQHDINYIEKICQPLLNGQADMCIGTRYLDKRSSEFQSTAIRRLGSKIITIFIKIFAGKRITDPTSGFRAVNKKVIEEFSREYPKEYPEPESTVSLLVNEYKIEEVPVNMNERKAGKSFVTPIKSIDYMVKVILAIIVDSISFKKRRKK